MKILNLNFFCFLFAGCILFLAGCEEPDISKPQNLIPEDHYIDLLAEMQLIRVWHSSDPDSINADSLKQEVYSEYKITEDQFLTSHSYYEQFIAEQSQRVSEAISRLESEIKMIEDQDVSAEPDSAEASVKQ